MVRSPQTLTEADRRLAAAWAADCAERVLALFEAEAPDDGRPRALIARTRAFARGELKTAEEIRRRFVGGVGAGDVKTPPQRPLLEPPARPSPSATWARTRWVRPLMPPTPPALRIPTGQRPSKMRSAAARAHVGRASRRAASSSTYRSELVGSSRARAPRLGPTRHDHP